MASIQLITTVALMYFGACFGSLTLNDLSTRLKSLETLVARHNLQVSLDLLTLKSEMTQLTSGGEGMYPSQDINVTAIRRELQLQRERWNELESALESLQEDMSDVKAGSNTDSSRIYKMAFFQEKTARKNMQAQVDRNEEVIAEQNTRLTTLEEKMAQSEQIAGESRGEINELTERLQRNEQMITKVNDAFENKLLDQVHSLQTDLDAISMETEGNITAIATAMCNFHPSCTDWSEWGACSNGCGSGTQSRERTCRDQGFSVCSISGNQEREERDCDDSARCCPDDYTRIEPSYCFQVYKDTKSITDIKDKCEGQGDQLVFLSSAEKEAAFIAFARTHFSGGWWVLIDGQKIGGEWVSSDGNPLPYTNWNDGNPGSGDCIYMQLSTGKWRSTSCSGSIYTYFCERI